MLGIQSSASTSSGSPYSAASSRTSGSSRTRNWPWSMTVSRCPSSASMRSVGNSRCTCRWPYVMPFAPAHRSSAPRQRAPKPRWITRPTAEYPFDATAVHLQLDARERPREVVRGAPHDPLCVLLGKDRRGSMRHDMPPPGRVRVAPPGAVEVVGEQRVAKLGPLRIGERHPATPSALGDGRPQLVVDEDVQRSRVRRGRNGELLDLQPGKRLVAVRRLRDPPALAVHQHPQPAGRSGCRWHQHAVTGRGAAVPDEARGRPPQLLAGALR